MTTRRFTRISEKFSKPGKSTAHPWKMRSWRGSASRSLAKMRMRFTSMDERKLLAETLEASAAAFLFPYGERKVWFNARLDESDSDLKPGLALSKVGDFEGAFKAFEQVSTITASAPL